MLDIKSKISLGIDITSEWINIALVKRVKDELKLLKSARAKVPEGAMTDGNISDAGLLARMIRDLLKQNKIRTHHAAISLVAKPVLTQVIDLPEELPGNLGQFVQSEIKHSAVFAGKEAHYDFCGLGITGSEGVERVFVGATDSEKVSTLLKTLSLAGVEPASIELPVIAALRALYAKKIADKFDCNLLVAFLHNSVITLCVFRKTVVDFIRCIDMSGEMNDPAAYISRFEREIDAVTQFYDIEISESGEDKWEAFAACDSPELNRENLQFSLQKKFGPDAHVCSSSSIYSDTLVMENESIECVSITAVGLAMKSLGFAGVNAKVDLLPPEAEEVKATKRMLLVTANVAAAILLVMFMAGGYVQFQLRKHQEMMSQRKQVSDHEDIEQLLTAQRLVNSQIEYLSDKKSKMDTVCEAHNVSNWSEILGDIARCTPTSLCIKQLRSMSDSMLVLEGEALSYKSIHLFAELLGGSDYIESATVSGTNKSNHEEVLITYSIHCELPDNRNEQVDVN